MFEFELYFELKKKKRHGLNNRIRQTYRSFMLSILNYALSDYWENRINTLYSLSIDKFKL